MADKKKVYSIFGAGASGLYTAWRLLGGGSKEPPHLKAGDTLELYDWGKYDFNQANPGSRAPGARVCTWHYKDDPDASFLEVGGMRYSEWNGDNDANSPGHRLVTTVIKDLGLDPESVPFDTSDNTLYCLRARNQYLKDISSSNQALYNATNYQASDQPDRGLGSIQAIAGVQNLTRVEWCKFYDQHRIAVELAESSVFKKGDRLKDIGYWNLMFDQLGSEGYQYVADGNGYSSNVINWNTADAIQANNDFTPGTKYKTLKHGYSSMFAKLFDAISALAKTHGVQFDYHPNTRLHSILRVGHEIHYWTATRETPDKRSAEARATDAAWLAMSRHPLDLVSQATRYQPHDGLDVLNHPKVQNYLESAILEPSYKVGMFFDSEWWLSSTYPPKILGWEITSPVLAALEDAPKGRFEQREIEKIRTDPNIYEVAFTSEQNFIKTVENRLGARLTLEQEQTLTAASKRNTIGPSVTDMPIRQVVYFGNNAPNPKPGDKLVYGLLGSYDDEQYTGFWSELELGPNRTRTVAPSQDYQTLEGPREVPPVMVKMLRSQLATIHFGPGADYSNVPEPLEVRYMDWSLPPFNAGYHVWAAHYDIDDVMRMIRKPSQLIEGADANIFIVGETYSIDQGWVEGAYCTAESVVNDFFGVTPIIDPTNYPFICGNC